MKNKILTSVIELTKQRDTEAFGISLLATIAELIPNSFIALFRKVSFPTQGFEVATTLSTQKDQNGIEQYLWDLNISDVTSEYIQHSNQKLNQLTVYQTRDGIYHTFIPIRIDNELIYGVDIASEERHSNELDSLLAITKLCENFYTILAVSEKDSLTGLYNRRTYEQKLNSLLNRQSLNQQSALNTEANSNERIAIAQDYTWLAMIDIDFFKRVNDQFGHIYGDEVLLVFSQLMKKSFRSNDLLFRFGGEEFVIIFEPILKEHVMNVLEEFRKKVEAFSFPLVGNITISCGFAKISRHDHPPSILNNADKALYFAKGNGRNCIQGYEELVSNNKIHVPSSEGNIELF